jgi:hypothetical protein
MSGRHRGWRHRRRNGGPGPVPRPATEPKFGPDTELTEVMALLLGDLRVEQVIDALIGRYPWLPDTDILLGAFVARARLTILRDKDVADAERRAYEFVRMVLAAKPEPPAGERRALLARLLRRKTDRPDTLP